MAHFDELPPVSDELKGMEKNMKDFLQVSMISANFAT